jgi:glycosyltransferase involved in cell wall biosynthesis
VVGNLSSLEVTVVVPMYNAAATIERCIASITAQTKQPAGIIVVDDCSTDDSVEIVNQLGLPSLEVLRRPVNSGGVAVPRNNGTIHAQTEFVAFIDADDVWMPTFLERVCDAIERLNGDYGGSGGLRVNREVAARSRHLPTDASALDLTDEFWRVAQRFMPIHPAAMVARKSLLTAVGGFPEDLRIGEDLILFTQLWLHGRFVFVNESLFESIAPPTGLTGGHLPYRDVRIGLVRSGKALVQAVRMRRRGTGWFAIWFARRLVNRHVVWLRRRMRRPANPER